MYGICVIDDENLVGCARVKDVDGEFKGILIAFGVRKGKWIDILVGFVFVCSNTSLVGNLEFIVCLFWWQHNFKSASSL